MTGHKEKRDARDCAAIMRVGQVVRSVSGRDRKRVFIVVGIDESDKRSPVIVANGTLRTLADGKHKNPMHLRLVGTLDDSDIKKLESHPSDSGIAELCNRFDGNEKF